MRRTIAYLNDYLINGHLAPKEIYSFYSVKIYEKNKKKAGYSPF